MIFKISFNLFYVQLSFSGLLVFLLLISVILITVIIIITSIFCIVCPVISIMFVIRLKTAIIYFYSIIHTFNGLFCVCFIYRVRYRNCCTVGCLSFLWYTLHFITLVSVGGYSGAGTFWLLQFFSKF